MRRENGILRDERIINLGLKVISNFSANNATFTMTLPKSRFQAQCYESLCTISQYRIRACYRCCDKKFHFWEGNWLVGRTKALDQMQWVSAKANSLRNAKQFPIATRKIPSPIQTKVCVETYSWWGTNHNVASQLAEDRFVCQQYKLRPMINEKKKVQGIVSRLLHTRGKSSCSQKWTKEEISTRV